MDNHSNTQTSTPDYIRRNIYKYQKVNKRATIYISKEHVELYKKRYGTNLSFNGYIKMLMEQDIKNPERHMGLYKYDEKKGPVITKSCIFAKEYESRLKEVYPESENYTKGGNFKLKSHLQYLVHRDLSSAKEPDNDNDNDRERKIDMLRSMPDEQLEYLLSQLRKNE